MDPVLNITLDNSANRAACYRCHPGSTTKCLRGAMGSAIAADGSMAMQCQSCHGNMSQVGSADRVGWFMEPNCQSCHTGTATSNNGQIRYTSVFMTPTARVRVAGEPDLRHHAQHARPPGPFALPLLRRPRRPAMLRLPRLDPRRVSQLRIATTTCATSRLQGHAGVMVECTACHTNRPTPSPAARTACIPSARPGSNGHHDGLGSATRRNARPATAPTTAAPCCRGMQATRT